MANEGNLKPFEKGNKQGKGRPKGSENISTIVERFLKQKMNVTQLDGKKKKLTGKEVMVLKLMGLAFNAKSKESDILAALKELKVWAEGLPTQPVKVEPDSVIKVELTD